ncbi:MAG: HAD-IIB family hydrolase, partial [Anaerolineae bacterium]|nr:HAD-IIB family hydrolase [Anaerolineae bacterium]
MLKELGRKIKVIICDLDQTLLNSQKQISQNNLEAIRAAQAKGIFVTICSGRIFTMLETYARDLSIEGPLISTNGAALVDCPGGKILASHPIERQTALQILENAAINDFDYAALTPTACYFSANSIRVQRFLQYNEIASAQGMVTIPIRYLDGFHDQIEGSIFKILIQQLITGDLEKASVFLNEISGISVTNSEEGLLDVMKAHVDKGTGVVELRDFLGVEKAEV